MIIPETNLIIDNFNTQVWRGIDVVHVLTHFHTDHRQGLKPNFRGGILCSEITGNLLLKLGVNKQFIKVLSVNDSMKITPEDELGIKPFHVTFIDANHCPGSVSLIIRGSDFNYFYMGDSRISRDFTRVAKNFHWNHFDVGWIDSTFYDESSGWDSMPMQSDSAKAMTNFVRNVGVPCALEFEMLGTEILLEALLEAFASEKILVESESRLEELGVVYEREPFRLERLFLAQPGMLESGLYRFIIISRESPTPEGFVRVRATTQRWASRIREAGASATCPILEYNEKRRICHIFFSIHSSKKEIDELVAELDVRKVVKLVAPIEVNRSAIEPPREKTRRERCVRRDFEYSSDGMWLEGFQDSQETVRPSEQVAISLPVWRPHES